MWVTAHIFRISLHQIGAPLSAVQVWWPQFLLTWSYNFFLKVRWSYNDGVTCTLQISLTLIGVLYLFLCANLVTIDILQKRSIVLPESRHLTIMKSSLSFKLVWSENVPLFCLFCEFFWCSNLVNISLLRRGS